MEGKIFFLSPCTFCQLQYSRNAIFHQGIHVDWSREIRNDVIFFQRLAIISEILMILPPAIILFLL